MKTYEHPLLGDILFRKNKRAKRIILRVKPQKGIIITLPPTANYQLGLELLNQNIDWVKKQQDKIKEATKNKQWNYNSRLTIAGKAMKIIPTDAPKASINIEEKKIDLKLPTSWQIEEAGIQNIIVDLLIFALRTEGKKYLPYRTNTLAKQKGISFNKVTVKKIKTRWGSCSNKKNINLSLYLMLLPFDLIDYVIMHELAHLQHQNHSPAFWQHLETLLPNSKKLDKRINAYRIPF